MKLLKALEGLPDKKRGAYFETVVACVDDQGEEHLVHGRVHGRIAQAPRGKHGFGYDSLFIPDGSEKTFAEMSEEEKNKCSHRRLALDAFVTYYREEIGKE